MGRAWNKIKRFFGRVGKGIGRIWHKRNDIQRRIGSTINTAERVADIIGGKAGQYIRRGTEAARRAESKLHEGVRKAEQIQEAVSGGGH